MPIGYNISLSFLQVRNLLVKRTLKISLACILVFTGGSLNRFTPAIGRIQKSNPGYNAVNVRESMFRKVVISFIVSSIRNNFGLLSSGRRHLKSMGFIIGTKEYNKTGRSAKNNNTYGLYMIEMVPDITCLIDNDIPP